MIGFFSLKGNPNKKFSIFLNKILLFEIKIK